MDLIRNKKAKFDYQILDRYEAGLELLGPEVKSLKKGQGKLDGAHVIIRGDEAFVVGLDIPPYQPNNMPEDYDPGRTKKLLLKKKEIREIEGKLSRQKLTIVPISVYNKGKVLKLSVALAKGKKEYDKRETIKRREADREMGRTLKKDF